MGVLTVGVTEGGLAITTGVAEGGTVVAGVAAAELQPGSSQITTSPINTFMSCRLHGRGMVSQAKTV